MRKFVLLAVLCLSGCISYSKSGWVLPVDDTLQEQSYSGGNSHYRFIIPYDTEKYGEIFASEEYEAAGYLRLYGPFKIQDDNCRFFSWILFPVYFRSCESGCIEAEKKNFHIEIYKKNFTLKFLEDVKFSLIYDGKTYLPDVKSYHDDKPYASVDYSFPVSVLKIKEKGAVLVISYHNFYREVPIQYKLLWHKG